MKRLTDKRLAFPPDVFAEYTREWRQELDEIPLPNSKELYYRLALIEDILGEDYDLDRLRELVEADREGRCYVATIRIGESVFLANDDGKIVKCRVQGISLPVHGKNLIIHLGGYPAGYLWSDREGKDWWKSCEAAEAALKGEK